MIEIKELEASEIVRLAEIDRTEHITLGYVQDGEKLVRKEVDWNVPPWSIDGDGDHSVNRLIKQVRPYLEKGGVLLGALDGYRLAGIGVLHCRLTETMAQLVLLHVSREYRRQGIATRLTEEMIRLARESGATEVYVSATPSESAVGFYISHGFRPTGYPIRELLELEPEDIHMTRKLS